MHPVVRQARTAVVTPAVRPAVPAQVALAVAVVQAEAVRTVRVEAIAPEVDAPVEAVDVAKR